MLFDLVKRMVMYVLIFFKIKVFVKWTEMGVGQMCYF